MAAKSSLAKNCRNVQQQANLTHFRRIPMAAGISYSPMEDASQRLKQDPCFDVVPKGAFTHLDNLHYTIGELRLDSPQSVDAACELLRSLEKDSWRHVTRVLDDEIVQSMRPISTVRTTPIQPFKVDLVGMGGPLIRRFTPHLPGSTRLYTYIQDSTGSLQDFCWGLFSIFRSEGFGILDPSEFPAKRPLNIMIGNTRTSPRSNIRIPHRGPNRYQLMRFDARDIEHKYQNVAWVKDVLLQEIRISKIGRPRKSDSSHLHHAPATSRLRLFPVSVSHGQAGLVIQIRSAQKSQRSETLPLFN